MDAKNEEEKFDIIMPGFRFHPTDEELVGFYLKRKLEQRPLPIELIKQVDIYKYDPWDLPKLASTGEKELYFYCPRDRKYRNSTRPNRVTGSGFWKATGIDRPIYSSEGNKCIGLKKSLVFYRGRAAKGIKTDWMMHEFRLPSIIDAPTPKKLVTKNLPPNDSWAICKIFKKTNSLAQRALSQSWIASLHETPDGFSEGAHYSQFTSEPNFQLASGNELQQPTLPNFSPFNVLSHKPTDIVTGKESVFITSKWDLPENLAISPSREAMASNNKCTLDVPSMFFNLSPALIGDAGKTRDGVELDGSRQEMHRSASVEDGENGSRENRGLVHFQDQWQTTRRGGFPFILPLTMPDSTKLNLPWDSPPCPSEISTTYSTNKF